MVVTGADSTGGIASALFLCPCGRRKRARVLRSGAIPRNRSTVLRSSVTGFAWRRAAHGDCRNGEALSKRDPERSARRPVLYWRAIAGGRESGVGGKNG